MKRTAVFSVYLALFFISGCTLIQSPQSRIEEENIVGKIDNEPVTYDELRRQFAESSTVIADDLNANLSEFLGLYMDYRIKLAIVDEGGYMEHPEVLQDLKNYEQQAAYPFLIERHIKKKLLDEMYERSLEHVHVQHILIEVSRVAPAADTAHAYEQLMEARERFLQGEDFMALSDEYSTRQRGRSMGEDLGFISTGWALKPFEDAMYSTPVGEVSMPVRTSYGYHLVHVKDRIESGPNKSFSHIYFRTRGASQPLDSVRAQAQRAYNELENGVYWDDVVEIYSQDDETKFIGGDIGWIRYGMIHRSFTDTIMQIENTGEYTKPFTSQIGMHIVRLDSIHHPSEAERRRRLERRIEQLPRFSETERAVRNEAAQIGNARFHRENLLELEAFIREDLADSAESLTPPASLLEKPVFSFLDQTWSGTHFLDWLKHTIEENNHSEYHYNMATDFRDQIIDSQLATLTKERFPEFTEITRDYHTGLAVFKVNEDSIWTYAQQDTAQLKRLFEANPENYRYDTRYQFTRISILNESRLEQIKTRINNGMPLDSIRYHFFSAIVRRDATSRIDEEPYTHLEGVEVGEFSPTFIYNARASTFYVHDIREERPMTFEEAYNKLVSDYQEIREQEWIEAMRKKYRMEIYPDVLQQLTANTE
ncbi:MAG: peptidylprolyl isomerase [Balneolales bacterium]